MVIKSRRIGKYVKNVSRQHSKERWKVLFVRATLFIIIFDYDLLRSWYLVACFEIVIWGSFLSNEILRAGIFW